MSEITLGLFTGILFGILLQQGRVLRYEKQLKALLFKDMTIFKFMFSAIIVGGIGIHLLVKFSLTTLSIKPAIIGANLLGGILFGIGWAIMGYCPGTSIGAIGEGRWHAIWAVAGMITGAAAYAETYPHMKNTVHQWGDLGKITLPSIIGLPPYITLIIFAIVLIVLMIIFEIKKI